MNWSRIFIVPALIISFFDMKLLRIPFRTELIKCGVLFTFNSYKNLVSEVMKRGFILRACFLKHLQKLVFHILYYNN